MNGYLRQSTASQSRLIGPFVDSTDFKTAETALTIANTDIKLRANGATLSNKNSGGGTHQVNGMYSVTWDATDTANVGELFFSVVVTGALAVFGSYVVLEEVVYDAMFAASAPGYVTDQPVNVTKVNGTAQTAGDLAARLPAALISGRMDSSVGAMAANVLTASAINADAITDAKVASDVTIASVTGSVGSITSGVTVATNNDKTGYALSAAGVQAIWDQLTSALATAGSIGKKLADWALGSDNKSMLSTDAQTGVTIPTVTTLTNPPNDSSGVTTLLSRLSALRAGYLDNLSAGAAALESSLQGLITTVGAAGAGLTATASAVWAVTTRLLTAGTNIALAKGTGITGLNDLSAAEVNAEVDQALADYDGPTFSELTNELAMADDATLAAIGSLNVPTAEMIAAAVWEGITDIPFPSTLLLEDFDRADEDPATGWTKLFTSEASIKVFDNQATGPISSWAVFTALSPADDQEAYVDISTGQTTGGGLGNRVMLLLRVTGETSDDATGYYVLGYSTGVWIYRFDSLIISEELGTFSLGTALIAGDQLGARAIGDSLEVWTNIQGAGWTRVIATTDATYSSGKIGLGAGSADDSLMVDNFGGGDVTLSANGAGAIANAVWGDDNSVRTAEASAGNKLRQALILYEDS